MPSMMNTMMELRKCCNHPYLIKGAEDQILQEVRDMYPEQNQHEQVTTALIQASGKLVLIDKLLPKLRQDGHKVLIFSQMVKVLDILEEFLGIKNFTYERIDGNVRGDLRQAAIDRFSKPDSDKFVFLLCTRAGGLGINLTAADTVIIFDSDWNPQNDLQAQARCHRIGQTKMVKVYRLITSNTYEREMFDRASLKLGLDKAVLQSMAPKEQNAPLTKKEVEDLLKKGAYGAVMDEDNEGSKFSEEDIETILQRRTTTITIEPGIKGSKFAKASFKSTTNEDIDVDDPNFWQKWANKAKIEIKEKNSELILEEPRSRRKRFDEYNQQNDNSNDDENSDDENNKKLRDRTTNDLRNRSGKKRRRGDDDDDEYYGTAAPPDELIFNKSEYFKLEKFILQFGWGRWDAIELCFEGEKNQKEVEHMTRTLLLHCLREFRGDERTRDYVWNLIIPSTTKDEKHVTTSKRTSTMFTDGWASKPEYNPPGFALDTAFHRHIYRHTNKLVTRVHHLHILEHNIITEKWIEKCKDPTISYQEIEFTIPTVNDPVIQGWDKDHDKCLIIGIYRHGAENYELINKDEKLLFHDKSPELLPTPMELNNRFKRIIQLELRKTETATQNSIQLKVQIQNQVATRGIWTEKEEKDFLKTLINFGVWDYSSGDKINIKWHKFRDYTPSLTRKTDGQMIENLYCILARCSLSMGTNLSDIDEYRAKQTRELPKKMCTIVMQRLTLMRKIHINFMTKDDDVRKIHIRMMPLDKMPNGWTHEHDEKMFQIADGCGISWFKIKLSKLPEFQNIKLPSEQVLFRRLFEIVATVDAGKYVGEHEQMVFEFEDDEPTEEDMLMFIVTAMFADKDKNGQAQTALQLALAAATVTQQQQPSTSSTPSTSSDLIGTSRRSQAKKKNIPTSTSTNKKEQQQKSSSLMSQADQLALQNYMALLAATTQGNKANEALQLQQQLAALMQLSQLSSTSVMAQNNALTVKALEDALNLSKKEPSKINMKISMYDPETKNKITGDKAPSITQLESWMKLNPKYRVDPSQPFMTTTQKKLVNSLLGTSSSSMGSTSSTSNSNKVNGNMNDNPGSSSSTPSTSTSEHGTLEPDMKISMYDPETKNKITGDKAPSITQLESWMKLNPKYRVDPSQPFMTTTQKKLVNSLLGTSSSSMGSTSSTSNSNKVNGNMNDNPGSSSSTPTPSTSTSEQGTLEPGEIPKPSTSKSTDYDNVSIGLWSRSTGQPLAKERWPTLRGLQNFLDKNPDYNVLSSYSTIVKNTLSKTYQNRIGGEEAVQALQAAMLLNPATAAYLLSAAGTVNPTTSAANNANANSTTALTPQQQQQQAAMDAIQMQIALSMYGPYAAMGLTGLGTGLTAGSGLTGANLNQFGSTSSTTPNTTKSSTKTTTTANSSNKNANSASSSSTTTTTTSATTSSNNVASQLLQESALTAELMSNPAFTQLLLQNTLPPTTTATNNPLAALTAELMSNPAFTQLLLQNTLPPTTAATNNPLAGYNMTEANFIQQLNALNTLQFLANQQAAAAAAANNQSTNPSTSQSTNPSTSQSTNQSTNTNSTPKPSSSSSSEKKSSTNTSTPSSSNSKKSLGKIVEDLTKGSS
uniref:Helicase C-terminal domain-containing protein n=1 Tax=Panagrolaimus sp. JU765 TaxID=591449 RepID=A0AC34QYD0_9BILA